MKLSALCFIVLVHASSVHSKEAAQRGGSKVAESLSATALRYAASVKHLNSCSQYSEEIGSLPLAISFLKRLSTTGDDPASVSFDVAMGGPQKKEYEKTVDYEKRIENFWPVTMGDHARILIKTTIFQHNLQYDVDSGIMTVDLGGSEENINESKLLKFDEIEGGRPSYVAKNALGMEVEVMNINVKTQYIKFPANQLFGKRKIEMTIEEAKAFRNDPRLYVWFSLSYPFQRGEAGRSRATYSDPTNYTYSKTIWYGDIRCAVLAVGTTSLKIIR